MTMQINVDPAGLTQEQREAVAGFILAYPAKSCGNARRTAHAQAAGLPGAGTDALDPEIAALVKDDGEFQASVAFGAAPGDPVAAAAFGSAPTPLPHGATAAPSIAVAAPPLTAPAAMPGTTSTATPTVPAPPAPNAAQTTDAPLAAPSTPASGVDVDKRGLPWDGRIHAGTKRKNADGSWSAKRGVDPTLVAQVEAELRAVMGAPAAAPLAPAAPASQVAPIVPPPPLPSAPVVGAAPATTAAPNVAPSGDARQQFVGLVGRASTAIQGGKVTQAEVSQCCADAGVPALPLLANRLDLVPQVAAAVDALIAARQ